MSYTRKYDVCIHFIFKAIVFAFYKTTVFIKWLKRRELNAWVMLSVQPHYTQTAKLKYESCDVWWYFAHFVCKIHAAIDMIVIFSIKFHVVYPTKMEIHVIQICVCVCLYSYVYI